MLEKFFSEPKTLLEAIEAVVPPSLREGKFRPSDKLPPTVGSNPMMLIAYRPSQTLTWTGDQRRECIINYGTGNALTR